jgi:uncharacterized repeat protein (TIGR03803 family)
VALTSGKAVQVPLTATTPAHLAGHDQVKVTATLSGASASTTFPLTVTGEQLIYSFGSSAADSAHPYASLIQMGGDLYGTTQSGGGTHNDGTVFELIPSGSGWTEQVIHSFTGSDGAGPYAPLIQMGGNLYGTAGVGGTNGYGTAFELIPSGSGWNEKVIYNFAGGAADGAYPIASLTPSSNGNLYGTTSEGGANGSASGGDGTVFELIPSSTSSSGWNEKVIYSFGSGSADGVVPSAALVPGSSGDLYGTTYSGGTNGYGTAFELIPSGSGWTEQVIHSFTGSDGAGPYAPLIQMGGNLYGTTYRGGANSSASGSDGTAFELIPSGSGWNEQVIYNFAGGAADGANPQASLIPGSNGDLYGTTYRGGTSGVGTVFKIVP